MHLSFKNIWASTRENPSSGEGGGWRKGGGETSSFEGGGGGWREGGGETTKRICAVWTAPLLITFWKEAYLNLWNFNFLASLWSWADWFECRFVRTPEDKFSCDEAHMFWVLKRTILSSRWFFSVSTMYVLVEKYENLILTTHSYHPWV